jgi:hypothetical protein
VNGWGGAGAIQGNEIYDNEISYCRHGTPPANYDGSGVYIEAGAADNKVYRNNISYCHHAIQDNSGRRNSYEANIIHDCDLAFVQTDADKHGNADITLANNLCLDMSYDELERAALPSSPIGCIISFQSAGAFRLRKNIISARHGSQGDGLRINTSKHQTISIENNIIDVDGDEVVNGDGSLHITPAVG